MLEVVDQGEPVEQSGRICTIEEMHFNYVHKILDKLSLEKREQLTLLEAESMRIATGELIHSENLMHELVEHHPALTLLLDFDLFDRDVHPEMITSTPSTKKILSGDQRVVEARDEYNLRGVENESRALLKIWNVFFEQYALIRREHPNAA